MAEIPGLPQPLSHQQIAGQGKIQGQNPIDAQQGIAEKPPVGPGQKDSSSRAAAGHQITEADMARPEGASGSSGAPALRGSMGAGNPWLNANVMVAVRLALDAAISINSEMRRESREASMEAMNWLTEEGKNAAQQVLRSGLKSAELLELDAQQHTINGSIMLASAVLTGLSFVGGKLAGGYSKNKLQAERTKLRAEVDQPRLAPQAGAKPGAKGLPKNPAQVRAEKDALADVDARLGAAPQQTVQLQQMLTQFTQQLTGSIKEFFEASTDMKKAGVTREKAYIDHIQKMSETYEKLAQKLQQTSDQDAKEAADMIAKFLQALDQIISAGYKAGTINVHG